MPENYGLLGWPKSSFGFFRKLLWKNPNEIFGQPNIGQTFWGLQAQDTASQTARRDLSEEVREEPGYVGVLQQSPRSWNIKRLLLIKENQTSQVREFSAYLCMGRCMSLGSLKSFLWYARSLSRVSTPFFPILSSLMLTIGGSVVAGGLMATASFVCWYGKQHFLSTDAYWREVF